ncbi:metal-dependent hydrolase [Candidatus Woesearchaeota archaeon]|nr:metal-dependent hydrolase [Candidatus Woesearchaeota archaeon]
MPFAVTHVLVPLILSDIYRDFTRKGRKLLTRRMALFAGISGLIPDMDIPVFLILSQFSSIPITSVHRTITHSLFLPLLGLVLFFLFRGMFRKKSWHMYALMFAFGTFIHIVLDGVINGTVMPFYPLSFAEFGLDLVDLVVPSSVVGSDLPYRLTLLAGLDAVLLVAWLAYEEWKHKIRDFI